MDPRRLLQLTETTRPANAGRDNRTGTDAERKALTGKERRHVHMRIEAVKVVGRYRKDLGDIDALARSIASVGLMNPITVTSDGQLIAGQRRLEACRSLGLDTVEALMADDLETAVGRLTAERDENTERKEMTVSERVGLAQALEALESERLAEKRHEDRVRAGLIRQGKLDPARFSDENRAEKAIDVAARAVDLAPTTYYKARKVVEAAEDQAAPPEDRAVAQSALADMDATGNVAGNYEKVRKVRDTRLGAPQKPNVIEAKKQRHTITSAAANLSGIAIALNRIGDIHPEITSEEAARWVDDLSETRRVIEGLIKRLKERTNA